MTDDQRRTIDEMLRANPFDVGGDVAELRRQMTEMVAAVPLATDVRTAAGTLGGVPVIEVDVDGVTGDRATGDGVLLHLHGGAYALGSAADSVGLASDVARRARTRAVTVDYRLAPEHPYPAALEDAVAAYGALLETTDPARVALVGESSGGGLALATLVALRDRGVPLPSSAVVFSPWADLTLSGATATTNADLDPVLTVRGLRRRARDYVGDGARSAPTISPVFADLTGLPPLLLQAGSNEILLDDAVRVAARAAVAGVAVDLQVTPDVPHVFQGFAAMLSEGDDALTAAGEFLRTHLASDSPARPA